MKKNIFISLIISSAIAINTAFGLQDDPTKLITGTNIGNKAPEISMADTSGKIMKLSDLKGSLVLIDFWAAWCGPCRRENPFVVSAYTKYKDVKFTNGNGFKIFSVSLDNNREAWKMAIAKDGLIWKNHVSDLRGWYNQAAQLYGVNSIPANFLIDKNGVIIAKDLRGNALEAELSKYVKAETNSTGKK